MFRRKNKQNKSEKKVLTMQQPVSYGPYVAPSSFGSGYYGSVVGSQNVSNRQAYVPAQQDSLNGYGYGGSYLSLPRAAPAVPSDFQVYKKQPRSLLNHQAIKTVPRLVGGASPQKLNLVDRVLFVNPQRDMVDIKIVRPPTPPPQMKERTVYEKQEKPMVNYQIVRLPPRPAGSYAPAAQTSLVNFV